MNFTEANFIRPQERDKRLELERPQWPGDMGLPTPDWQREVGALTRVIDKDAEGTLACAIRESILRFPSARVRTVQRIQEYPGIRPRFERFHSLRVLQADSDPQRPKRIYIFHNGLNEIDRMGFYYQVASHLVCDDPTTLCILRPFPGHLTRFRQEGYAELPLDRYLQDGSHLFRQFVTVQVS